MNVVIPLILVSVMLNAAAQLLLKAAMDRVGEFAFNVSNIFPIVKQLATNPFIIMGGFTYIASIAVWLLVLSRAEVSYAYPMISLGYIVTAIAAYFFMGESLSVERILGILIIIAGVYLVAKT